MAYQIEQTVNGRIYLYEVQSYWDKDKKQARQKRKYLGPKEKIYNKNKGTNSNFSTKNIRDKFISKSYGDTFVIREIQNRIGIKDLLKKYFPDCYKDILSLSSFLFEESTASYLYPFWHDDHYIPDVNKLYSTSISNLYDSLGNRELEINEFMKGWINHINPTAGIYYDITSISSYSTNNEYVEWGYNRDKEYLPQINLGFTYCKKTSLPLSYRVHPGSIVDVTTLKNTIKMLNSSNLKDLFLILDRGFCSVADINEMYKEKISFIQPLSYSQKKAKELLQKNKLKIVDSKNAFVYNKDILYHIKDKIELGGRKYEAHLYYNEKLGVSFKHNLYSSLFELESKHKLLEKKVDDEKYLEETIPAKYQKYYKVEKGKIKRNTEKISDMIFQSGSMILVVSGKKMTKETIIESYRTRDKIEKEIEKLKNQIDCKRLRSHKKNTSSGRLFVKFISMIESGAIMNCLKRNNDTKHYSLKEAMLELRKIKISSLDRETYFVSELTSKQKKILKALNINKDDLMNT